ncbi:MAG: tetratricopeptide repeat protein, partial [Bacteroidia bacterium]|nr:tetratricopeptide repeat protein [Bacteroidia bacterium]
LHDRLRECGWVEPLMAGQELKWMGSAEGSLPPPLPIDSLKQISRRVPEAQAILSLETLLPGGSPQQPEVLAGFRLYDAKTGQVIDEVTFTSGTAYRYGGIVDAHADAVEMYIHRICPCFPAVPYEDRSVRFYVKGSPQLEQAKAAIMGRRWEEAIALWEKDVNGGKASPAKRAAYNLAVLYDALCEVEKAEEWYRRAVGQGLGQREYEEWGRTRRSLCQRLNAQLPRQKRNY